MQVGDNGRPAIVGDATLLAVHRISRSENPTIYQGALSKENGIYHVLKPLTGTLRRLATDEAMTNMLTCVLMSLNGSLIIAMMMSSAGIKAVGMKIPLHTAILYELAAVLITDAH